MIVMSEIIVDVISFGLTSSIFDTPNVFKYDLIVMLPDGMRGFRLKNGRAPMRLAILTLCSDFIARLIAQIKVEWQCRECGEFFRVNDSSSQLAVTFF